MEAVEKMHVVLEDHSRIEMPIVNGDTKTSLSSCPIECIPIRKRATTAPH